MIHHRHLSQYVIRPVLEELKHYYHIGDEDSAENLLLLTAAIGSEGGKWLHQDAKSSCAPLPVARDALGIYGMEPAYVGKVRNQVLHASTFSTGLPPCLRACRYPDVEVEVCANLRFATALARMHFHFTFEPLPLAVDNIGMAAYWRTYWNAPPDGIDHVDALAIITATQDVTAAVAHCEQYRSRAN